MNKYKTNVQKIYLFNFFSMFLVIVPVIVPYFLSLGLSMSEVLLIQALFGMTMVVFEVPSAYIGDLWGRKPVLILGSFFYGLGFSMLHMATDFWGLIFYEVLLAIGASFISGADLSLLYDSIGNDKKLQMKAMGNYQAASLVGEGVAAILCSFLGLYGYAYIVKAQFIVGWIPFILSLSLLAPKYKKMNLTGHRDNMLIVFRYIFKDHKTITLTFWNLVLWSLGTFCAIWLTQKYWSDESLTLSSMAILWALCNFIAALSGKLAPRLIIRYGLKKILIVMALLVVTSYITMGINLFNLGIFAIFFFCIARGLCSVALKEEFNHQIPTEFRNTANSLNSLFFRLGFFFLGPCIGYVIDQYGLDVALYVLGGFFTVCFVFLLVPLLKRKLTDSVGHNL
jgi:MFS family permease